jgi:glutamate-ammonia-ligase adenylyltransferase
LREHRPILALFSDILGSAPRLADIVAVRPHLLDAIIDPAFIEPFPELPLLIERMKASIGESDLAEDFLDRLRETGQHEMFLVSVRMLSGVLSPEQAGSAFAAIAEGLIRITLDDVHRRFSRDHGFVKGGRLAVLGMGRLGSREMTATSDLDLVVLYDFDPDCVESDGSRPLDPTVYFGRLTQRLISALTVPTRRGTLYAVDMRLRPSGNKGPAATQYRGFLDYHFGHEADLWEHLALVRARPVAGDFSFMNEVSEVLRKILTKPRDIESIRKGTREMRELLAREKGNSDPWDFKHVAGGLMDIEFVAQALVLEEGATHPDLIASETTTILSNAKRLGLMNAKDLTPLIEAYSLMRDMMQWLRAMVSGDFSPSKADRALLKRLATLTGLPDFKMLELHFAELREKVGEVVKKRLAES